MNSFKTGNASFDGIDRKGWFIGHFIEGDPLRQSDDVELKWAHHRKGETNGTFAANRTATTISILIHGRFRVTFRTDMDTDDVLLEKQGDYALWPPLMEHDWEALEDCVILTVRWPSRPRDQE